MTGREFIVYILQNNLEDEVIFDENGFNPSVCGFMTVKEAAVKFEVGESTIKTWSKLDMIKHITIGDDLYFPVNAEPPKGGI